jgi:hypothetical protein
MVTVSIPLSSRKYPGLFAIVDEEDYERVSRHRWHPIKSRRTFYVGTNIRAAEGHKHFLLHRFIMGFPDGVLVDHIDGNGLNCVRGNMRPANDQQNAANRRLPSNNTSGYKGVFWDGISGKWSARIKVNQEQIALGLYDTAREGAIAYDMMARKYFGAYAHLNFPDEQNEVVLTVGRKYRSNTSGFKGVTLEKSTGKWRAVIRHNGKNISLGLHVTPEQAAAAYDAKAIELLGARARINGVA